MHLTRLSVGLFLLSGLLLLTMGGAVFAAPVTVPLMYLAVRRHPTAPFRWFAGVLAGLTTVALGWSGVYLLAANQNSDSIVQFRIDAKSGKLTPTGKTVETSKPVCLQFVQVGIK